jgi:AraC family transcriptional regulator
MEDAFSVQIVWRLRNMVSRSCILLIQRCMGQRDDLVVNEVRLGWVALHYEPRKIKPAQIEALFRDLGFPRVRHEEEALVEAIKIAAIELIHYAYNANSLIRNSDYLSEKLQQPYDRLSRLFSTHTGITLEQYLIRLKIEKVKELLTEETYTLSEIAYMLGYSSVQYLSNQFRKITGMTVTAFKQDPTAHRHPLEDLA